MVKRKPLSGLDSDKNTKRIEKQSQIHKRVQKGMLGVGHPKGDMGLIDPVSTNNGAPFPIDKQAGPSVQLAVDPALERERAASGVAQDKIHTKSKIKRPEGAEQQHIPALQDLKPNSLQDSKNPKVSEMNATDKNKAKGNDRPVKEKSSAKRTPKPKKTVKPKGKSKNSDPAEETIDQDSAVWEDKGDPKFGSVEDRLPGPL